MLWCSSNSRTTFWGSSTIWVPTGRTGDSSALNKSNEQSNPAQKFIILHDNDNVTCTFKQFENSLPPYLSELLHTYQPSRTLRSSSEKLLKVPKDNLRSAGYRSFHFQAANIWNSLPTNVRSSPALSSLKKNLKTHLFKERFSLGL